MADHKMMFNQMQGHNLMDNKDKRKKFLEWSENLPDSIGEFAIILGTENKPDYETMVTAEELSEALEILHGYPCTVVKM